MQKIHPLTFLIIIPFYILVLISISHLLEMTTFHFIALIFTWVLIGGIGLELGHHRYWAHNQFKIKKITEYIISYLGCLSLHGSPIFWRSHHIMHHKHTDEEQDPHSPSKGFFHATIGWSIDNKNVKKINFKFAGKTLLTDKFQIFLQKFNYIIIYISFLGIYILSDSFFWLSFIPAVFLSFHQGPLVNYFCHYHNNCIQIRNLNWLSYFTWGLSLHQNHHERSTTLNFSSDKTTIDLGYILYKFSLKYA